MTIMMMTFLLSVTIMTDAKKVKCLCKRTGYDEKAQIMCPHFICYVLIYLL